jgi:pimeloyl-ACP methyl ester carboxylesterase
MGLREELEATQMDDPNTKQVEDIFLFHGKGGRPTGSVMQLEELLRPLFPQTRFHRPALLHNDLTILAEDSLHALEKLTIPKGATIIGISLGGLVAARLQETARSDVQVIAISSPTWADGVSVAHKMPRRLALYSSGDAVIEGRTADWPQLAEAHDLPWLTHDTDAHKHPLTRIAVCYLHGGDVHTEIEAVEKRNAAD